MTRAEALRKLAHLAAFWPALLLPWLHPIAAFAVTALLLAMNLFALPRWGKTLYREGETGRGGLEIILYPAALMACVAATGLPAGPGKPAWYLPLMAAWFGLAVVDACIGAACRLLRGGPRLPWNDRKPVTGVLLGLAAAALPALAAAHWAWPHLPASSWVALGALLLAAGAAETLWFGIADNLVIPFTICVLIPLLPNPLFPWLDGGLPGGSGSGIGIAAGGGILAGMENSGAMIWFWALPALAFGAAAYAGKMLSPGGTALGALFAFALCLANPWLFFFLGGFFALGNLATRFGRKAKEARGIAEPSRGRRGADQVFGAMGLSVWMTPLVHLAARTAAVLPPHSALLICIAPLIAKTMDTLSSEIGKAQPAAAWPGFAWANRTFSLLPWGPAAPGVKGGLSPIGTLAGLAGAGLLAAGILPLHWGGASDALALVVIAVAANLFESAWGAWAAPRGLDQGAHTNVLMTLLAAVLAWLHWAAA